MLTINDGICSDATKAIDLQCESVVMTRRTDSVGNVCVTVWKGVE